MSFLTAGRETNVSAFVLIAALLLTSSSHANTASPPPVSTDAVEGVLVTAPEPRYVAPTLRDRIGRIWAPVYINGKGPFRLVLDTGANRSAVLRSVADRLGIPVDEGNTVRLHGATGSAIVPMIKVDSVEVGDLWIDDTKLPIVQDVFGGAEGVLGTEGLGDKRIFIDFRNDHISILRSRGERPGSDFKRVPVELVRGRLLMFEVMLGGVRTKAMLDTGAQATIGNHRLREALERRVKEGRDSDIIGVTLDVAQGRLMRAPTVNIGGVQIRGMSITFGDIFIFDAWKLNNEPALLIGMDVIGVLDSLVIDYRRKELHLKPRR
jgi:predicted aspartyl protease